MSFPTWNEIQASTEDAYPKRFNTIVVEWDHDYVGCESRSLGSYPSIEKAKQVGYDLLPEDRDTRTTPGHCPRNALDYFYIIDKVEGNVPFSQVEITQLT